MKNLLALLLLFAPLFALQAQTKTIVKSRSVRGSFSGTVTDGKTGAPLAGATVQIVDLKLGAVTDAKGSFSFQNLPTGSFLITIGFVGFNSISQSVYFDQAATQAFRLQESYAEANDVVVTGQSKATQIKRSPVPIISVSHDYIIQNLSTNIIDAIAKYLALMRLQQGRTSQNLLSVGLVTTGS